MAGIIARTRKGMLLACLAAAAGTMVLSGGGSAAAQPAEKPVLTAAQSTHVQINDKLIAFPDAKPFVDDRNRLEVPLRFVTEQLGYQINWKMNGAAVEVTMDKPGQSIQISTGDPTAAVNGNSVPLDSAPQIEDGRVYLPLRFLADTLSAPIRWDENNRTAILEADGRPHAAVDLLAYSSVLNCKATAYSSSPAENGSYGAVDYFGQPLQLGTVAVDPSVIPLGSELYIEGYDDNGLPTVGMLAHAVDEGSAIRGNRIDIFIPGARSNAEAFGIQQVKVYVLSQG